MKICPKCKIPLDFVFAGDDVYSDDHLMCMECHGTYNLWDETLEEIPSTYHANQLKNLEG